MYLAVVLQTEDTIYLMDFMYTCSAYEWKNGYDGYVGRTKHELFCLRISVYPCFVHDKYLGLMQLKRFQKEEGQQKEQAVNLTERHDQYHFWPRSTHPFVLLILTLSLLPASWHVVQSVISEFLQIKFQLYGVQWGVVATHNLGQ